MANLFLLQQNGGFLLQENGGKLIIGETFEGPGGGKSRAVGYSAVKKQLGLKPTESFVAKVKGTVKRIITKQITKERFKVHSKLVLNETSIAFSKLLIPKEPSSNKGKIVSSELCRTKCIVRNYPSVELLNIVEEFKEIFSKEKYENLNMLQEQKRNLSQIMREHQRVIDETNKTRQYEKDESERKIKIEKLKKLEKILREDLRKTPKIQVTLNTDIHQRGDLMRITANMSEQSGAIWMRIIDSKGMIVQKAGQVKTNATGFQILAGTRDLKQGKYIIQVSNHANFSPIGVAEFQVKGNSPILPFVPIIPFLLTPDSPTQKVKRVIFRTMQDSRVDAICKTFENKEFNITDKNLPIPPIHFNCRCHLEGIDE